MSEIHDLEKRVSALEGLIKPKNCKSIDKETRTKIVELRSRGHSYRSIEALTGVSFSTCRRVCIEQGYTK